jgi:signal recognition particle GTPase
MMKKAILINEELDEDTLQKRLSNLEKTCKKAIFLNEEMDEDTFQKRVHELLIKYVDKSAIEKLLEKVTKENVELKKQLTDARRHGNIEANKASRFERQVNVLLGRLSYVSGFILTSYICGCADCPAKTSDCDRKCVESLRKWSLAEVKEEYKL